MMGWHSMDNAPRDGTWVILNVEAHGHLWEPRVGRWNPKHFDGLGVYDWEVVERRADDLDSDVPADDLFNHYASPVEWMPLP